MPAVYLVDIDEDGEYDRAEAPGAISAASPQESIALLSEIIHEPTFFKESTGLGPSVQVTAQQSSWRIHLEPEWHLGVWVRTRMTIARETQTNRYMCRERA